MPIITQAPTYDQMLATGAMSALKVSSGAIVTAATATVSTAFVRPVPDTPAMPRSSIIPQGPVAVPSIIGTQIVRLGFEQIVGAVPMRFESDVDARGEDCDYVNPVFGVEGETDPTYENDYSSFLLNLELYKTAGTIASIKLQKIETGAWATKLQLGNNNVGQYFPIGSISGHPTYVGYALNWGAVLQAYGSGCYRVRATQANLPDNQDAFISEVFNLLSFSTERARENVKFEWWLAGRVGDKRTDYRIHDLTGMWWYDSIRVKGWFGLEKIVEYKEVNLEWGPPYHGKIERVRDEAISQFEFKSYPLPKYIHERFATYGLMANKLQVSDYNLFNSDFNIKQMAVIKDGNYEPEYFESRVLRAAKVSCKFRRGVQGTIKSNC